MITYVCGADNDAIVLDFFAGSGTTAEAVLQVNATSGFSHRFVVCQLPEPCNPKEKSGKAALKAGHATIADITKERVRRVIKKLDAEDAGKLDLDGKGKQDRGFRVFKLDQSNFLGWDGGAAKDGDTLGDLLERTVDHIRQGRTDDDLLYELLLKSGFPLTTKVETKTIAGKTVLFDRRRPDAGLPRPRADAGADPRHGRTEARARRLPRRRLRQQRPAQSQRRPDLQVQGRRQVP